MAERRPIDLLLYINPLYWFIKVNLSKFDDYKKWLVFEYYLHKTPKAFGNR